jgi:outer membrane protein
MRHRFKYKFLLLAAFWQLTMVLWAQDTNVPVHYNLKQLITLAEENNKDLQLLKLELQKVNQEVEIKKSNYLPKIDAFANYYWYWGNVPQYIFPESEGSILSGGTSNGLYPVSIGLPNNILAGVSLSQRIFEFSYLHASKSKVVLDEIELSRINEQKAQLYYDVAVCYYEISQLAAKEDFIDFNVARIGRFVDILQIQLQNQMTDSLQLFELELTKAELSLSKRELKSGMQRKTNYLKMLVGLPDSIALDYGALDYYPVMNVIQNQNENEENVQLKLLNYAQNLNELSQKQVQSDYLPTLDLKLNLLWNVQSQNLAFASDQAFGNQISTLGLKLDIPIYHGNEKKKKIQKIEIDQQIIELQKQKLLDGYQLQYANSMEELKFKMDRFYHHQEITQLKKRYLDKANNQFEQGMLPIKELLGAQSELLEAQMNEVDVLFQVKIAELNYSKWSNQILTEYE